jgi:hypothetical protein
MCFACRGRRGFFLTSTGALVDLSVVFEFVREPFVATGKFSLRSGTLGVETDVRSEVAVQMPSRVAVLK